MDIGKVIYVFIRTNAGVTVEKELLRRVFNDGSEAKVIVTEKRPMIIRYAINREVFSLSFHYGFWNHSSTE